MEIVTKGFGYLIAFVLPGLIALKGIGFAMPDVDKWLNRATENASMGAFLLAVAIGVGVFLSALRALLVDPWLPKEPKGRRQPKTEEVYQNLIEQHFMYAQFYGNSMPATAIFVVAWAATATRPLLIIVGVALLALAVECVLFWAARYTKRRLKLKIEDLLEQPTTAERKEHV